MRLMIIIEKGFNDYARFKQELDSYPYVYELLYFAQGEAVAAEFCKKYSTEELEYFPTPVWNFKGEEFMAGFSMNALLDSVKKIDQAIWFVQNTENHVNGTVHDTYTHAGKPIKFVETTFRSIGLMGWFQP